MCGFCDALKSDGDKIINLEVRSTMADDNICEFVNDNDCGLCSGCNMKFYMVGYCIDENIRVQICYNQKIMSTLNSEVIIYPFTETIQYNFCPMCGEQISKDIKQFKDNDFIQIEDRR